MNTEEDEFQRIEREAKRRAAQDDDDTQVYTSEMLLAKAYRFGFEAGAVAEREACAKVCSEAAIKLFSGKSRVSQIDMHTAGVLQDTAEAIRARGTT